jgi:hypothetical protein
MNAPAARRAALIALLACGAVLWFVIGSGKGMGPVRWLLLAAAVGAGVVPPVRRRVCGVLDRVRHPSQAAAERTALLVGVLATAYFTFTAFHQDRDLFPKTHDEGSYLLGVRMLAAGRLWMPPHELADFFDTFYVLVEPLYASIYFPGTALMYAPSVWLGWPTWALPVVASGAIVALLYRVVTELVDGVAGLLAALLMASLSWFRMLSILLFSHVPMLLLGLLMVWAYLRWRRSRRSGWLLAIAIFAGWAAITRPVDALCYAVPVGLAVAYGVRRQPMRHWATAGGLLVAGATPFLTLQMVFNKGVTGSLWQTPYTHYLQRDQPQTSYGFHRFNPSLAPQSPLAQKRQYYRSFMQPMIERHTPSRLISNWVGRDAPGQKAYERPRLPMLVDTTIPFRVLLPLAFAGLLGLTGLPRWTLCASLPLLVLAYLPNTFFLEHYAIVAAPAVILCVVLGVESLAAAWPRAGDSIRSASVLGLVTLALCSTYELNPLVTLLDRDEAARQMHRVDDETFHSNTLRFVHTQLPELVQKPAVVLFRYAPGDNVIEEPVYNNAAPWPDDQDVVRAHDLGERNIEIVRYYAERQPDRTFYRFDRAVGTLTPLGAAPVLLREMRAAARGTTLTTTASTTAAATQSAAR